jgi:hypothetical protein
MTSYDLPRTFKLRKLCSSTEEYEADAGGPIDLDRLALRLSLVPGLELSRQGIVLTVLFEDQGAVVRLFPDGRALVQAGLRGDAELVCSMLSRASAVRGGGDSAERI